MFSFDTNRLGYETVDNTTSRAGNIPCISSLSIHAVHGALYYETFLQSLSETSLIPQRIMTGTYDGMRGDGETLPSFALRIRRTANSLRTAHLPVHLGPHFQTHPAMQDYSH